jgi:MFS transporter, DHA1 family, tetracycline resistance protein
VTIVHKEKISLFPLLLINFIGTLGFSNVLPFLVFLVQDLGGNAIVYGILSATYPAFQLIGAPILGISPYGNYFSYRLLSLIHKRSSFSNLGIVISYLKFLSCN